MTLWATIPAAAMRAALTLRKFHQTGTAAMTLRSMVDMMEATRLTRQGRLEEAMAVLRGALPGPNSATIRNSGGDADRHEGHARTPSVDVVSPPTEVGSVRTAAPFGQGFSALNGDAGPPSPAATNAILDRVRNLAPQLDWRDWSVAARCQRPHLCQKWQGSSSTVLPAWPAAGHTSSTCRAVTWVRRCRYW